MNSTRRNVALLAACQAMLFTNNSTLIAINGLAGLALLGRPAVVEILARHGFETPGDERARTPKVRFE